MLEWRGYHLDHVASKTMKGVLLIGEADNELGPCLCLRDHSLLQSPNQWIMK